MTAAWCRNVGFGLACLGAVAQPTLAQAQSPIVYTVVVPSGGFGSTAFLRELLGTMAAAQAFCRAAGDQALQVDCLSERLETVGREIPEGTDYDEVRSVLQDTADRLHGLARRNRDRERRQVTIASAANPAEKSSRYIIPVAPSAQAAVSAEAERILDEAATVLLRSAEGDQGRRSQYLRIAQALDSSKLLLRS